MVPAQCYERVVRVNTPGGYGAGFSITRHETQWLVTAQHVVDGVADSDLEIVRRDGIVPVGLREIPRASEAVDVAVFALDRDILPDLSLTPSSDELVFTQDVYFLGYPMGLGLRSGPVTYPFVKKAIASGFEREPDGATLWFFDGINNPGFSGGPVVFNRQGSREWRVAAVVSGYLTEELAVNGGAGSISANTGIVLGYDIQHALDSIDAYQASRH